MPRTARLLPLVAVAALLLVGCVPDGSPTTPPPSDPPVFASDEEALAAAAEAYGTYLATVDAIFADGGQEPERLLQVASERQYESELPGFEEMQRAGLHGTGQASFQLTLQSYDAQEGTVTVYSCDDISETDVLDSSGVSVVADNRQVRVPYEVKLAGHPLLVAERSLWQGSGVCT